MRGLAVSPSLTLPLDAVTETLWWVGKRGSGKTHNATVFVEELLRHHAQVLVIDPMRAWYGLRSAADGAGPGFPIAIFGGPHGDIPLEPTAGGYLAELVTAERLSVIFDIKGWSKADRRRFVTDFLERLLVRNEAAVHVVLEEAALFAPQRPMRGEERMLGACEEMVRLGRGEGIGSSLISQRSATIHKEVTTQTEVLVAHRTPSPQDRAAIKAWFDVHDPDRIAEAMARLPRLPTGTAIVSSTSLLDDLFTEVAFRPRTTFDSSSTPKVGEDRREARTFADVDLAAIKEAVAATIERAEADDPKKLKRRIADLERRVQELEAYNDELVAKYVAELALREERDTAVEGTERMLTALQDVEGYLRETMRALERAYEIPPARDEVKASPATLKSPAPISSPPAPPRKPRVAPAPGPAAGGMTKAERSVLTVLAQQPDGCDRTQLALLSGYSIKSSSLGNALGALRSAGYVDRGEPIRATTEGLDALGEWEPLPTGEELIEWWMARLDRAARTVLGCLLDVYPGELTKAELAERSGYSVTSSSLGNALGKLRSLKLVEGNRAAELLGRVRA